MHHGADHLARGEELSAIGVLLAHFQQQIFIDLRQGEKVGVVDMVGVDLMHLVENVAQVGFAIHPHPLDGGHDAADNALLAAGTLIGAPGQRADVEAVQMSQQVVIDKIEQSAITGSKQLLPLPAKGFPFQRLGVISLV